MRPGSADDIADILDRYRSKLAERAPDVKFTVAEALEIMRADPEWLVDDFAASIIERYFFYRDPSKAFDLPFDDQPDIWITCKQILDRVFYARTN